MEEIESATVVKDYGIEGEHHAGGKAKRNVTLITEEAIDALRSERGIDLAKGATRRNITTRGIDLNGLVGKEFLVGKVLLLGTEIAHPCSHLERLTRKGVKKGLAGRGGIRARVIEGGSVKKGDPITPR